MLVIEIDPTGATGCIVSVRAHSAEEEDVAIAAWQKIRGFVDHIDSTLRNGSQKAVEHTSQPLSHELSSSQRWMHAARQRTPTPEARR